ncbi:MAG TPA: PAS domain S-box protein [Acidimicrobiales bacterium]|nr:PAS domain S-box protein [Acidimicrobiales bacterium]
MPQPATWLYDPHIYDGSGHIDPEGALEARLSAVNSLLDLFLVLPRASSPGQVVQLATGAVPAVAPGQQAMAWHPSNSGAYYQQAPDDARGALTGLRVPTRLHVGGFPSCWAFPFTCSPELEQAAMVVVGDANPSDYERLLLSVLAQFCGTAVTNLELSEGALAIRERDIAQARAAELASSEARQRAILEAALDAVVSMDSNARVTYVNSAFEQIFGYRAEDVIGRELAEVIVPPSLRDAHRRGLARYLSSGEATILDQRMELAGMRSDGSEFPAEVTVTRTGPRDQPSFTGYVRDITERRRAEQELAASRARLVAASDAARQRVTRDLHDGAQQRLVTTLLNLQLAEEYWQSAPERAKELLGSAIHDARRGIEDLREIVAGIHPAVLTQHGLAAAIDALAARLPVPVRLDVADGRLQAPVEASVYFFCSEALTNLVKHANATSAWVRVQLLDDICEVEVGDDGIGGAEPQPGGGGLTGLRDRVGALNGTIDIASPPGGGTVLRASIPMPQEGAGGPLLARPSLGHQTRGMYGRDSQRKTPA